MLSDTHLRDDGGRRLPDPVYEALLVADAVLHCGDVVERDLLDELATTRRLRGARQQRRDVARRAPRTAGRRARQVYASAWCTIPVRRRDAPARVCGVRFPPAISSCSATATRRSTSRVDGQRLLNPGSATQRRRQPHPSFATARRRSRSSARPTALGRLDVTIRARRCSGRCQSVGMNGPSTGGWPDHCPRSPARTWRSPRPSRPRGHGRGSGAAGTGSGPPRRWHVGGASSSSGSVVARARGRAPTARRTPRAPTSHGSRPRPRRACGRP